MVDIRPASSGLYAQYLTGTVIITSDDKFREVGITFGAQVSIIGSAFAGAGVVIHRNDSNKLDYDFALVQVQGSIILLPG